MLIEVQIAYSEYDNDWEVNVWDRENDRERIEDLERVFPTEEEAVAYVKTLVADKQYDVVHI